MAYIPPVTGIDSPVIAAAPSEAKNTAVLPISDGSSKRLIHCLPKMWCDTASSSVVPSFSAKTGICFSINSVRTGPGSIQLTVIPFVAFSNATTLEKPVCPALAAQ